MNRYLKNREMDRIDHALGRPVNPLCEGYRNFYAVCVQDDARHLDDSLHWAKAGQNGGMIFYRVTDAGRAALAAHLREIGDRHRNYIVTFDGRSSEVVGKSPGNAKYRHYLNVAYCLPGVTLGAFLRRATVRAA